MADDTLTEHFATKGRLFNNEHDVPRWLRDQLVKGYRVELEHGSKLGPRLNVSKDSVDTTLRIALAHLVEAPDYYDRLEEMERAADAHWETHKKEKEEKKKKIDELLEQL